jgi:hypothetical protein
MGDISLAPVLASHNDLLLSCNHRRDCSRHILCEELVTGIIEKVKTALEPFAVCAGTFDNAVGDEECFYSDTWGGYFTVGNLRRARAALAELEKLGLAEIMYHYDHFDTSYLFYRHRQNSGQAASIVIPILDQPKEPTP